MPKIIFIPKFTPSPTGHGGNHRSYQIDHDLRSQIDGGKIITLSFKEWLDNYLETHSQREGFLYTLNRIIRKRIENPFKLFSQTNFILFESLPKPFIQEYLALIHQEKPDITIVEDAGFYKLTKFNQLNHIRSICIPQNLESLDTIRMNPQEPKFDPASAVDLANEIRALSKFDDRLMISRVETGYIGGLGISSNHYPYLPVGEIKQTLLNVRERRTASKIDNNLFLMIGSGVHPTTREAFMWFLDKTKEYGLPKGAKVIIGGMGTETLLSNGSSIPGIQIKGWLESDELNSLLATARAALIPQFRGFGSLTRLSEFSCAGIPVIVSNHPIHAVGQPPGCSGLANYWDDWYHKIQDLQGTKDSFAYAEYQEWEKKQFAPLNQLLQLE